VLVGPRQSITEARHAPLPGEPLDGREKRSTGDAAAAAVAAADKREAAERAAGGAAAPAGAGREPGAVAPPPSPPPPNTLELHMGTGSGYSAYERNVPAEGAAGGLDGGAGAEAGRHASDVAAEHAARAAALGATGSSVMTSALAAEIFQRARAALTLGLLLLAKWLGCVLGHVLFALGASGPSAKVLALLVASLQRARAPYMYRGATRNSGWGVIRLLSCQLVCVLASCKTIMLRTAT